MGERSVNRYARIEATPAGVRIRYVLELAEDPSRQLLTRLELSAASPRGQLEARAAEQGREWASHLAVTVGGRGAYPRVERTELELRAGDGGRPVLRVAADLKLAAAPAALTYEDRNYPGNEGWREIVVAGRDAERSQELRVYPPGRAPADLRAEVDWSEGGVERRPSGPAPAPAEQAPAAPADPLARLLHQQEMGWGMMLAGLALAFGLGAVHALSPGHGKTIVAAYLVGTRGSAWHAVFLGGMVTFTHTISVFFLGFVTLFLSRYVQVDKLHAALGTVSGVSIVWIGSLLLYRRWRALGRHSHPGGLVHDHGDGRPHSHVPEGDISLGGLVALGAGGGLVPCPSALVLLLSSVALGRVGLGLVLLTAFSAGLAVVLTAIGLAVLYARNLLPGGGAALRHPAFRLLPVVSAAVIVCVGLLMTAVSLGLRGPG